VDPDCYVMKHSSTTVMMKNSPRPCGIIPFRTLMYYIDAAGVRWRLGHFVKNHVVGHMTATWLKENGVMQSSQISAGQTLLDPNQLTNEITVYASLASGIYGMYVSLLSRVTLFFLCLRRCVYTWYWILSCRIMVFLMILLGLHHQDSLCNQRLIEGVYNAWRKKFP